MNPYGLEEENRLRYGIPPNPNYSDPQAGASYVPPPYSAENPMSPLVDPNATPEENLAQLRALAGLTPGELPPGWPTPDSGLPSPPGMVPPAPVAPQGFAPPVPPETRVQPAPAPAAPPMPPNPADQIGFRAPAKQIGLPTVDTRQPQPTVPGARDLLSQYTPADVSRFLTPLDEAKAAQASDLHTMRETQPVLGSAASLIGNWRGQTAGDVMDTMFGGYKGDVESKLLHQRAINTQELAKAQTAQLEHDPNGKYAQEMRYQILSSPQLDEFAKRVSQDTGRPLEIVKAEYYKNHLQGMTPFVMGKFLENMKSMGEFTTGKMNQALIDAQRENQISLARQVQLETSNKALQYKNAANPNSAASRGFRAFVLQVNPDLANDPNFSNMSVNDLLASGPGMQHMFDAFKSLAANQIAVAEAGVVNDDWEAHPQGVKLGGLYGKQVAVAATPADKQKIVNDISLHPVMWDSGADIIDMVATMGGGEAAAKVKANSPEGAALRSKLKRFASSYAALNPGENELAKKLADALAGDNIKDVVWGAQGKGGLIMDALRDAQAKTAVHHTKFKQKSLGRGGPEQPPFGFPFTVKMENGVPVYVFHLGDRQLEYTKVGSNRWQHVEIMRPQPGAKP